MNKITDAKLRLFVEADLGPGAEILLEGGQAHYLVNVMRRKMGDGVLLFNGRDGEWLAEISETAKKVCHVRVTSETRPQEAEPDLRLLFAPIKRLRLDYTVQKATELGVSVIQRQCHRGGGTVPPADCARYPRACEIRGRSV